MWNRIFMAKSDKPGFQCRAFLIPRDKRSTRLREYFCASGGAVLQKYQNGEPPAHRYELLFSLLVKQKKALSRLCPVLFPCTLRPGACRLQQPLLH
jgi:hypothetical protein